TNPTIDVSSLLSEVSNIPQMTINTSLANVYIPATTVTSSDPYWNGIFEAPRITTVTLPTTAGSVNTLGVAIEIGLPDYTLTFGKGVKIIFPNQANKKVGFVRPGQAFTEITTICSANDQTVGDALAADGQCKINVGSDMVVWTKHFSKYATYSTNGVPNTGLKSQNIRFDGAMLIVGLLVVAGALRFSYRKN
ncbi:MAG: hypothetical protein WCP03_04805, partial [Candidatus Saccharibacteria bacterium]